MNHPGLMLLAGIWLALPARAAQEEAPVEKILGSLPSGSGIGVHLGCGEGALLERLAESSGLLFHALDDDEARVAEARRRLHDRGLYGRVSIEAWAAATLPYADDLVNLVVAERPGRTGEEEILRVLVPGGAAWVRKDGAWRQIRKPRPAGADEWTHWRHGADGNMVSRDRSVQVPTGVRWVAGPPQDAGGKKWYYDHVLVSSNGRNYYAFEEAVVARDAYNGSLLWTRAIKSPTFREPASTVLKLGQRMSKVRPVAWGDTLFVAAEGKLLALEGATGRTAAELGVAAQPRELLLEGGRLVLADGGAVRAYDAARREVAWEAAVSARRIVAGDGALFCLSGSEIVCLDLATGRERWRVRETPVAHSATCTYRDGVLVLERATWRDDPEGCGIRAYRAEDGKTLWEREYSPNMTHYQEARSFFAGGLLWLNVEEAKKSFLVAVDPKTGEERRRFKGNGGEHCAPPLATERFFIAPECNFTDLQSGKQTVARMVKAACRLPFVPANGLLYSFPVQCECFPMLRGYMGLASTGAAGEEGPLLKPAAPARAAPAAAADPADWPMYRRDAYRSGSTPARLRGTDLRKEWEAEVAAPAGGSWASEWGASPFVRGAVTPPVAAGGLLVVAAPDLHRVVALDASTGKPRWTATAGGRVDSPPTLYDGLCLFGSHDGWVSCLNATDGTPVWRFRAAPREARIAAYGQLESPWPVPGSVLVDDGVAYFAAGRHPASDGGVHVYAVRARTGELVWKKTLTPFAMRNWYGPTLPGTKIKVGVDFEPVDMLVKDGDRVSMSRWRFSPATGDVEFGVAQVQLEIPGGRKVPRGLWGYGIRQKKILDFKPPAVFDGETLFNGMKGDVALLIAGGLRLAATAGGELRVGEAKLSLGATPVHDGMIAAYGRLYVATTKGTVLCLASP